MTNPADPRIINPMDRIGCLIAIVGFGLFLVGLSDTGGDLLNIPMMGVGFVVAFAGTCFFLAASSGGNRDSE